MVMGVLDQSFDVLVLRFGVQKRIYCKVRLVLSLVEGSQTQFTWGVLLKVESG